MRNTLRRPILLLIIVLILAGCAPPVDPRPLEAERLPPTQSRPTPTTVPAAPKTDTPRPTDPLPTETASLSPTPRPTRTAWEMVQDEVGRFRSRLDSASEGYNGLTTALDQPGPNEAWCQGLAAGVNDFVYVKDAEAEAALVNFMEQQGCP